MIKIDTLELPPEIIWIDKQKWSGVYQGSVVTLGGKTVVQAIAAVNGRPITLNATANQGWLTLAQVDALKALAAVPGAVYSFEYNGFVDNVVFNHGSSQALDLEPLVQGGEPSDYHFGTIRLLTI